MPDTTFVLESGPYEGLTATDTGEEVSVEVDGAHIYLVLCEECETYWAQEDVGGDLCPDCMDKLGICAECERSYGPHFRGPCEHR